MGTKVPGPLGIPAVTLDVFRGIANRAKLDVGPSLVRGDGEMEDAGPVPIMGSDPD
jgi:hypothetical protein